MSVLGSVRYFFGTVLPRASSSADWDEGSVATAFLWAELCEEIHRKRDGEGASEELDEHIHRVTRREGTSLCFHSLGRCSSLLHKTFLQNCTAEKDFFEKILSKRKLDHQEAQRDALASLCSELVEAVRPNAGSSLYYEIKAELFLDFLKEITLQLATEAQSETQLSLAFDMLCRSPEKMMIIPHVLLHQEECQKIRELQNFAANWVLLKVIEEPDGPLALFLRGLPQETRLLLRPLLRGGASVEPA